MLAIAPSTHVGATTLTPRALALPQTAFPRGATLGGLHINTTADQVNKDGIGGSATNGKLYQSLHFQGSLFEYLKLPPFRGAWQEIGIQATLFPTVDAAAHAYAGDIYSDCGRGTAPSLPVRSQLCPYIVSKAHQAGIYITAVDGRVEYIITCSIDAATSSARDQAIRDAIPVAGQEVAHIHQIVQAVPATVAQPQPAPNAPIYPPASLFTYPTMGTYNGSPLISTDHGVRTYFWTLTYTDPIEPIAVSYHVDAYPTADAAVRANADIEQRILSALAPAHPVRVSLADTHVDLTGSDLGKPEMHEWAYMLPTIHCNGGGGFVYRNLVVLTGASQQDDADACNSKTAYSTHLQMDILATAERYAAGL